jgi:PAS domain S-box-containing protein
VSRRLLRAQTLRQAIFTMLVLGVGAQLVLFVLVAYGLAAAATNNSQLTALNSQGDALAGVEHSMLEQRAELHDYLASGEHQFLAEYLASRTETEQALAMLRAKTSGTQDAGEVKQIEAAASTWEAWAESLRQQGPAAGTPRSGEGSAVPLEDARLFDGFHKPLEDLKGQLSVEINREGVELQRSLALSIAAVFGGSLVVGLVLLRLARRVQQVGLNPLLRLVDTAALIALHRQARIPYANRPDEIGQLARALEVLQAASAEREILVEQAPIGICRLEKTGKILSANSTLHAMLGYTGQAMAGRAYSDFVHPEDRGKDDGSLKQLLSGQIERYVTENRFIRADGSVIWCSVIVALQRITGRPDTLMTIQEDITDRKRQSERAARIQRNLLPQTTPELDGYELAGTCRPAEEVAGDFYDWKVSADGQLDLTVADVMGKGVGAALVMAALRTALRAAPPEFGPADSIRLANSTVLGGDDEGLFVTLFRARLDVASGVLRYVDAGHGHCRVRRRNGSFERFPERSYPIGLDLGGDFMEGVVQLEDGDMLVLYSDGLVESETKTGDLVQFISALDGSEAASDLVAGVMARMPLRPADDITLVVLRRLPERRTRPAAATIRRPQLQPANEPGPVRR